MGDEKKGGKRFNGRKVSPQSQLQRKAGWVSGPHVEGRALGCVIVSGVEGGYCAHCAGLCFARYNNSKK